MMSSAWARPSVIDDDRALETDIMRFMAILGFCLMAVFALIQSIPVSQQTGGVGLQTQPMLEEQLTRLHDQVRSLLGKVASLQAQVEQLQQSNAQWQARSQALAEQLSRSEAQLLQQLVGAQELVQALQDERHALASAQSQVRRLQRQAYREQLRVESTERALAQLEKEVAPAPVVAAVATQAPTKAATQTPAQDSAVEPQPLPVQAKTPVVANTAPTAVSSEPPSLTMRYASTAAIERLIAGKRTVLYGISGDRAWRSTPQGDFVATAKPVRPYELTESPGQLLMQRFRRGSGLLSASGVQWWVTLDSSIVSQISAHLDQHRTGQLVIQANGQVLHQPADAAALIQ